MTYVSRLAAGLSYMRISRGIASPIAYRVPAAPRRLVDIGHTIFARSIQDYKCDTHTADTRYRGNAAEGRTRHGGRCTLQGPRARAQPATEISSLVAPGGRPRAYCSTILARLPHCPYLAPKTLAHDLSEISSGHLSSIMRFQEVGPEDEIFLQWEITGYKQQAARRFLRSATGPGCFPACYLALPVSLDPSGFRPFSCPQIATATFLRILLKRPMRKSSSFMCVLIVLLAGGAEASRPLPLETLIASLPQGGARLGHRDLVVQV